MKPDDDSNQDISGGESEGRSENTGESDILSDLEEDTLDHQPEVLLLGQAGQNK